MDRSLGRFGQAVCCGGLSGSLRYSAVSYGWGEGPHYKHVVAAPAPLAYRTSTYMYSGAAVHLARRYALEWARFDNWKIGATATICTLTPLRFCVASIVISCWILIAILLNRLAWESRLYAIVG